MRIIKATVFFADNKCTEITLKENTAKEYKKIIHFYESKNKNVIAIMTNDLLITKNKNREVIENAETMA